jgi:hypothetical protein
MSHTQDNGRVEQHDRGERWDQSDDAACAHFEREGVDDRHIAERLGRTPAAVRSRRYRKKKARG